MEGDSENAQCRQNTTISDDISSVGSGNAMSLLPSRTESEERKALEEVDDCGVAAASLNDDDDDSTNTSRVMKREGTAVDDSEYKTKKSRDLDQVMEDDTDKEQCRENKALNGDINSWNVVSLLPCGTESDEPEEMDNCGVAAAASNEANTDSTKSSRDLSMPWVKDLPVHLLASFFQRMPPPLKRQVEMTTHQMAVIMKVHGWRKWDRIDITIPADSSGNFRVNESIEVEIGHVVDCVQLLLSRIRVQRFSMKDATDIDDNSDPYAEYPEPDLEMVIAINAVLDGLARSKDDGIEIRELRLDVPAQLLKSSTIDVVITAFSDKLTHISTPKVDEIATGAIGKCHHLKVLTVARVDPRLALNPPSVVRSAMMKAVRGAPQLERLHIAGPVFTGPHRPDYQLYMASFVRDLADNCLRRQRNFIFSAWFKLLKVAALQVVAANDDVEVAATDDQGMLPAMMDYDRAFATSPDLTIRGLKAFDERLHDFYANLTPPTTESPPQITSIDGSRVYKRLFKINSRLSGVELSIGFDESPEDIPTHQL